MSTHAIAPMEHSIDDRFWSKVWVDDEPEDCCWLWVGGKSGRGYGVFWMNGQLRPASRVAYILTYGPVPDDMQICHRCDNPPCCNPRHLFIGTQSDNMRDMVAKGRQHRNTKLNDDLVRAIRADHRAGRGQAQIAARYGVTQSNISHVVRRLTWAHVEDR